MATEWRETTLGDEVDLLTGFPFKSAKYAENGEGIRLLRGDNVVQGALRWEGVKKWPANDTNSYLEYQLAAGDVVLAMDRPWIEAGLKYAALSRFDLPALLVQRVSRLRGGAKLDTGFLRYLIGSAAFTEHILAVQTGTAVPHISAKQIKEFKFCCPSLPEQKAIAAVLGALDDKIELNRRMNATLEAMARALFQSWFVDFDPVRAKAEGRPPAGLDEPTAALFPTQFQDSERGPIPQGWTVGTVNDFSNFSRASVTPANFPDEAFDHYSLPAFDEGRTPKIELGAEIKSNKLTVPREAVLLSKLNPHIPRIWAPTLNSERRAICSTEFLVALPTASGSREFLFCLFTSDAFSRIYSTLVTGTTGSHQRIKAESVLATSAVIPPAPLVEKFTVATKPLLARINQNIEQSRTLATLRDTLQPKLLSGEWSLKSIDARSYTTEGSRTS